jgi:hypothetical protein
MTLNPSGDDTSRHDRKSPPPPSYAANERGLAPGLSYPFPGGNGASHVRPSDGGSYAAPSPPPLQSTSPPSHPQNHYGDVPAALSLTPYNLTAASPANAEGGNGSSSAVSVDRLMKMISFSVHREEDSFLAKKESNRVLEKELQQEQEQRRETQRQLDTLDETFHALQSIHNAQLQLATRLGIDLE